MIRLTNGGGGITLMEIDLPHTTDGDGNLVIDTQDSANRARIIHALGGYTRSDVYPLSPDQEARVRYTQDWLSRLAREATEAA
jgi:hypothetical protein